MQKAANIISAVNFGLMVLVAMLWVFDSNVAVPDILRVTGRVHPMILHLPVGMFAVYLLLVVFKGSFSSSEYNKIMDLVLLFTCFTALATAVSGSLLSHEPKTYDPSTFGVHRHAGFSFAMCLYLMRSIKNKFPVLASFLLLANIVLVFLAGHKGAEITHGRDFLFPKNETTEMLPDTGATVYSAMVAPILQKKCYSCHNAEKTKGGLILTDTLSILKGGNSGRILVPGNADSSLLVKNIMLPLGHEDHMPPDGKPQLSATEMEILKAWVNAGGTFTRKIFSLSAGDPVRKYFDAQFSAKPKKIYDFAPAGEEYLAAVNNPGTSVRPLYFGSPALAVSFFLGGEYSQDRLKKLEKVKKQVVHLSLTDIPVTDEDLNIVAKFPNLEKLILNGSRITDKGVLMLAGVPGLEQLSLSKTEVTPGIEPLFARMGSLKHVYLNDTRISESTVVQWQKKYPGITFYCHPPDKETVKLTPPILVNESSVLKPEEEVTLRHYINGVKILYTVDGTTPDSVRGLEYKGPVAFRGSTDIKAIAVREGWLASDVVTYALFERGIPPDTCTLLTKANDQYPGTGATTFTNARRGNVTNLKDMNWIAFRENPFAAIFEYSQPQAISKVSFCYGLQVPSYVFPPVSVSVSGSNDKKKFQLLSTRILPPFDQNNKDQVRSDVIHLTLKGGSFRYYKIESQNLPVIPKWHPGKGERGWLFIDEIFFYGENSVKLPQ